jgi:hypothetical protein
VLQARATTKTELSKCKRLTNPSQKHIVKSSTNLFV